MKQAGWWLDGSRDCQFASRTQKVVPAPVEPRGAGFLENPVWQGIVAWAPFMPFPIWTHLFS